LRKKLGARDHWDVRLRYPDDEIKKAEKFVLPMYWTIHGQLAYCRNAVVRCDWQTEFTVWRFPNAMQLNEHTGKDMCKFVGRVMKVAKWEMDM